MKKEKKEERKNENEEERKRKDKKRKRKEMKRKRKEAEEKDNIECYVTAMIFRPYFGVRMFFRIYFSL